MFAVKYNPALLTLVSATEGTFLKNDGKPTSFKYTFNKANGLVNINGSRLGAVGGASGSGSLAVITFKAKEKGTATLGLSNVHILPPTGTTPLATDIFSTVIAIQ